MLALKCSIKKLICVLVGLLIFPVYVFGGVVFAAGELNITLKSFSDFESLADRLSFIDNVDTININLGSDIDVLRHVTTRPGSKYIFDFTDDKFRGKTINIVGKKSENWSGGSNFSFGNRYKITNNLKEPCFLIAKNCSVNLSNVELRSGDCLRSYPYMKLMAPDATQQTKLNIEESVIDHCKNEYDGGAVYVCDGATLSVGKGTYIWYCGANCGGAIYSHGGTVNILNNGGGTINSCKARKEGGAIYSCYAGVLNLSDVYIEKCSAGYDGRGGGGAISLWYGKLKMKDVFIGECKAVSNGKNPSCGGAVYVGCGKAILKHSSIFDCRTDGRGGAIFCVGQGADVMIDEESKIFKCRADNDGGAICALNGTDVVSLRKGEIAKCNAGLKGDAVYLSGSSKLNIDKLFRIDLGFNHGIGVCEHNSRLFDGFDGIYCADGKSTVSVGSVKADLDDDFRKPCFGCACF